MNRLVRLTALLSLVLAVLAGCGESTTPTTGTGGTNATTAPGSTTAPATGGSNTAGVAIYKYDDTFMTAVRNAIEAEAAGKITVEMVDSQNAQPTQNEQVDLFISKGHKVLAINPVDRTAAGPIIDKAKAANIPVVFFNREPLAEDMAKWDKVYYVGAKAEESGRMQGQLVIDYWKANPKADLNGDGTIQYVMLKGEPGHQDAELRTEFSIKQITEAGLKVEKLAEDTGMWNRVDGQAKMSAFLAANPNIEVVLANNDDMALGAIEALKAAGYFTGDKFMPVFGVDATAPALEALGNGTMVGTVLNDAKNQGKATLLVANALAQGQTPSKENVGYDIVDGKYIWVPYKTITKENMADAQ